MIKNKKGFSLIELLAVIVILGIILAISTVAVNSIRAKQAAENRRNVFSSIFTAARRYIADHPEFLDQDISDSNLSFNKPTSGGEQIDVIKLIEGNYLDIDETEYPELIYVHANESEGNRHVQVYKCPDNDLKYYISFWDLPEDRENLSWAKHKEYILYNDCGCVDQSSSVQTQELCIGYEGVNDDNYDGDDGDIIY